jgi:Tfp pilus assembly protein PilX
MVTAIGLMFVMITMGIAAAAIVDAQTKKSARERQDESAFNLAEGVLTTANYLLTRSWPGGSTTAFPASCTSASVQANCPDPNLLKDDYTGVDYPGALQFTAQVRDNTTGQFYSDSGTATAPHYDSNGDGKLWVRATATVKQHTRALVGLVQVDKETEQLPRTTLLAGSLNISNNGKKSIICEKLPDNPLGNSCDPSSSTLSGAVSVRCSSLLGPLCVKERNDGSQITPHNVQYNYAGGNGLSPDALNRLRSRAVADGTYYTSCPASLTGPQPGMIVFVDGNGGTCGPYNGNSDYNTLSQPGMVIFNNVNVDLRGNAVFYGLIYAANPPLVGPAVNLGGNIAVVGGVSIDGNGQLVAGSSKINLIYDDDAFNRVQSYGAAHLVQNKWREFVPSG